ncbi:MAG: aminoglycoside phosphotransferase family protein [Bacteroidales bacterium]|nr:aminoglycoside phosphotransferase family protein [Bacteroidales bacterium]
MENLEKIVNCFAIEGEVKEIAPLGNGLINDTYKVTTSGETPDYVLQRINNAIFTDVELLQNNIEAATRHIRRKLEEAGEDDIDRKVLKFVPLKDSPKTYIECYGKFWRVSVFIDKAKTYEMVNPEYSEYAGEAFGRFEAMLADIPDTLGETIPDFHNMELRLRQLVQAVHDDKSGRLAADPKDGELHRILSEIDAHGIEMCKAEQLHREGKLPKRICHCDTKVNNMMFDEDGNVLCVIDLDTLMPSYVFSDFGDFLRTAANPVAEDSPEIEKVDFDMEIFKAFSRGYIKGTKSFLTPIEKENLPYAACLFPFMQAVRFFADYINGDTYYKIKYPEHNLVRTRNQMALFRSAMAKVPEMKAWLESL